MPIQPITNFIMRNFLNAALCTFCLLAPSLAISSPAPHSTLKARVIEAGVFQVLGQGVDSPAPETAAGRTTEHEEIRLIERTTVVSAKLGVNFGFRYKLLSLVDGPVGELEMRAKHPSMRGVDGKNHTSSTAPTHVWSINGEADGDVLYLLSEPYEVLPGKWTLQLLHKGRVIISQDFELK